MGDELPEGWAEARLEEFVYIAGRIGWRGLKADEYTESGPLFLSVHSLNKGEHVDFAVANHISQERYDESPEIKLQEDDILLAKDGAGIGKLGIVKNLPREATVNSSLLLIRQRGAFVPKFLFYNLAGPKMQELAKSRITGSATPHLFQKDIKLFDLAVPPLAEQQRIVTAVEALLARVQAARARLAKVPALLKRFRQSVLAAACSGELTADWRQRGEHDNSADGGDIPSGWWRRTIEQLVPKGGIFDGPFGSSLKTADYTASGVRVVRLENIGWLRFVGEKKTYISQEKYQTLVKHTVGAGDIIFASFIDEQIRVCVLPELESKAIAKADCFCLRPNPNEVDRKYLTYQLASEESVNSLLGEIHGATRPRINTSQLRKLEVRMCGLTEQHEIVRRVEALFALADKIEARVAAARLRVEKITQAILAKAFRGELVPTEADLARAEGRDYEPASVLLERIRAEREAGPASSASASRRRSSKKCLSEGSTPATPRGRKSAF